MDRARPERQAQDASQAVSRLHVRSDLRRFCSCSSSSSSSALNCVVNFGLLAFIPNESFIAPG